MTGQSALRTMLSAVLRHVKLDFFFMMMNYLHQEMDTTARNLNKKAERERGSERRERGGREEGGRGDQTDKQRQR